MSIRVKLKAILYQCDFRKNEVTLYSDFRASSKFPGDLKMNEAYLFVSGGETQLIWFMRSFEVTSRRGMPIGVTHTYRSRLERNTPWDPMMLQEYAQGAGIELLGIRSFEQAYKEQRVYRQRRRLA